MELKRWNGAADREPRVCRPCDCGCDERGGYKGVGYLTASNEDGEGFTLWLDTEEQFRALREVVGESG